MSVASHTLAADTALAELLASRDPQDVNPDHYIKRLLLAMANILDVEYANLYILDPNRDRAWLKSGSALTSLDLPLRRSVVGEAAITGKTILIRDMASREGIHKDVDRMIGLTTRNCLCIPIFRVGGKRTIGVLELLNKREGLLFSDQDRIMGEELTIHLSGIVGKWYAMQPRQRSHSWLPFHQLTEWLIQKFN